MYDSFTTYKSDRQDFTFKPDFSQLPGLRGGDLIVTVKYFSNTEDIEPYYILGTNPGKALIEAFLTDKTAQGLACVESRWKQFEAGREGGVGVPLIGQSNINGQWKKNGGVGIMQLYDPEPTAEDVWNWKANIRDGIALLNQKRETASGLHRRKLKAINNVRKKKGLPICSIDAIPPLNAEQLEREAIRRYNSGSLYDWTGVETKNCEGKWVEIKPKNKNADESYVDKFFNCNIDN